MELPVLLSLILSALAVILLLVLLVRKTRESGSGIGQVIRDELRSEREDNRTAARELREELAGAQKSGTELTINAMTELGKTQRESLDAIVAEIKGMSAANETRLEKMRSTVDEKLRLMQESNEKKLDEMRRTVDEKLHATLEKRLGESFKLVSERLEAVQAGLGEMRNLATGVGDLKKVLANVKTRGTLGEIQLGAILEDILTCDQFDTNVQVKEDSAEHVEYAIRLPGPDDTPASCIWLPIDSKFPMEDYQRLVDASDLGDTAGITEATTSLTRSVKASAKEVHDKYLDPPRTTDFAILFLATEGLYAEMLRQPGLVDELMRRYRIVLAGPTTLAAILNSLRMGFRTLAIEKRSSEVWRILGAVKTEFGKYGDVLDKLKRQLQTASRTVEETGTRTRAMERKLRAVEELPDTEATELLAVTDSDAIETEVIDEPADDD